MDELEFSIEKFPIIYVLLSGDNAIITRDAQIEVQAGTKSIIISNLTNQLITASIHVAVRDPKEGVILQNPMLRTVQPKRVETTEDKDLKAKIISLNEKLDEIDLKLNKISQKRTKLETLMNQTTTLFPGHYSDNKVQIEQYISLVEFLEENMTKIYNSRIELKEEKNELSDEKARLTETLNKNRAKKTKSSFNLSFTLRNSQDSTITIQIRYWVPAKWRPSYDLKISGETAELLYWGIIENLSKEEWNAVTLEISYASLGDVSMARPTPLALNSTIEGKLDEIFQIYGLGKIMERKQTTELLTPLLEKINVPADGATHAYLIQKYTSPVKLFYYWNAAETDYVVVGAEFKNGTFDLLPGNCNFFRDGKIIGTGKFSELIESNQLVRLPLAVDSTIIATKRVIEQSYAKKRMRLRYRLHLLTRDHPARIEILDILPLSSHARSKIRLLESHPEPSIPKEGLLQWNIDLQEEWDAIYELEIRGMDITATKSD